jgi:hypothetical protein
MKGKNKTKHYQWLEKTRKNKIISFELQKTILTFLSSKSWKTTFEI